VLEKIFTMTTIVLAHPHEQCRQFQVFAVYNAPGVHHVFAVQELDTREQAEWYARHLMEHFEADHFQRVIEVGEPIR
jgi:hypothetical protein